MSAEDLRTAANENLHAAGRALTESSEAGDIREFGPVLATTAYVPVPSFNRVLVTDPAPGDHLEQAVEWIADTGYPFWVTATEEAVPAVEALSNPALETQLTQPGMVRRSLEDLPEPESEATIVELTEESQIPDFVSAFASAFDAPEDIVKDLASPALLEVENFRAFIGYVDDEPVACGELVTSGRTAGVYTIGVAEPYRRRGIGEAMTWTVLRAGRSEGCAIGALQSSEMAIPLYEKMGFETVLTYHQFAPAE